MAITALTGGLDDSNLQVFLPGEEVPETYVIEKGDKQFFTCQPLPDDIFQIMQGKSFKADCTVPRAQLRYLTCLHIDLQGRIFVGEMVVNECIAESVLSILHQLFEARYPIERMRLIDYYDADDEQSMCANNSSAFNFRYVSHTRNISKHGLGMAVDINPLYNPYHKILANGTEVIEPATGARYLDRQQDFPYKIVKGDLCYRLFKQHGFVWGGDWTNRKDYQHFERP